METAIISCGVAWGEDVRFRSKRFFYVFVLPILIFAVAFGVTILQGVILYMWLGFFVSWGAHFYAKFYYSRKIEEE
ncbi:MAG: hypothetical protein JSV57_05045 [Candidatus Bathyarchaeota archaeon]|nr:MAG: hypothetical protein JSV57_05045 [Candidatus Bathyarchaeota archaeon]